MAKKIKSDVKYETTKVMEANATSSKEDNHVMHTLDGSMSTVWEENSPGGGVGEVLSYKFVSDAYWENFNCEWRYI